MYGDWLMVSNKPRMSRKSWLSVALIMISAPATIYSILHLIPSGFIIFFATVGLMINTHGKIGVAIIEPYYKRESNTLENPTEVQERRLKQLCKIGRISVVDMWVSSQLKRYMPAIFLGGFRFNRQMVADESFFTEYSEKEQDAIVVFESYLAKWHYNTLTMVTISVPLLIYFLVIAQLEQYWMTQVGQWPFIAGAILSITLFCLALRRLVYRGLRLGIERTDSETMRSVVEKASEKEGENRKGVEVNAADILIYPTPAQRLKFIRKQ